MLNEGKQQFLSFNILIIFILQGRPVHRFMKLGGTFAALKAFISGSRIPDWITYQSSGSEVKAKLPPNWFNSNFLGFAFSFIIFGHFSRMFMLKADVSFDWTSSDDSFPIDIMIFDMIFCKRRLKSDHVCLFYVPLPQWRNCSQVTRIKVSFMAYSKEGKIEIKSCEVGLVYNNEDGNHNNPLMIQFNSISSPPPPSKSIVVLEEIHEEEPTGNGCYNVNGLEEKNSEYHIADEEEPNTATAGSEDHSESDIFEM